MRLTTGQSIKLRPSSALQAISSSAGTRLCFITAEKGGVARAQGEGEKEISLSEGKKRGDLEIVRDLRCKQSIHERVLDTVLGLKISLVYLGGWIRLYGLDTGRNPLGNE